MENNKTNDYDSAILGDFDQDMIDRQNDLDMNTKVVKMTE
jgi:hypothetical protein